MSIHPDTPSKRCAAVAGAVVLCFTLVSCSGPAITYHVEFDEPAPLDRPSGVDEIPIAVGVYYDPSFRSFDHDDLILQDDKLVIPVGEASVAQFDQAFAALFMKTERVYQRPPLAKGSSDLAAVIEPRIEYFDYDFRPLYYGPMAAEVRYRVLLFSSDGTTIGSWAISGSDADSIGAFTNAKAHAQERTEAAIRKALAEFMGDFAKRPEVRRWLALRKTPGFEAEAIAAGETGAEPHLTAEPEPAPGPESTTALRRARSPDEASAVSDLDRFSGVSVEAEFFRQVGLETEPLGPEFEAGDVLAVLVAVKNGSKKPVLVSGANILLTTGDGISVVPAGPSRVAAIFQEDPSAVGSTALSAVVSPLLGVAAAFGETADEEEARDRLNAYFDNARVKDSTVAPGESASGYVYFIPRGGQANFHGSVLRVRLLDSATRENFDVAVAVDSGLGIGTSATSRAVREADRAYWKAIESSEDPADFRAYIAAYPNGQFKAQALQRVRHVTGTAGPMPKPEMTVGERWIGLRNGKSYEIEVVSIEGDTYTRLSSNGCRVTDVAWSFAPSLTWKGCSPYADGSQRILATSGELWPLRVGNRIRYEYKGSRPSGSAWSGTRTCEVKSRENVKIESGLEETFKIVCEDPSTELTYYVSPRLKAIVSSTRFRKRKNHTIRSQLTRLQRPGDEGESALGETDPEVQRRRIVELEHWIERNEKEFQLRVNEFWNRNKHNAAWFGARAASREVLGMSGSNFVLRLELRAVQGGIFPPEYVAYAVALDHGGIRFVDVISASEVAALKRVSRQTQRGGQAFKAVGEDLLRWIEENNAEFERRLNEFWAGQKTTATFARVRAVFPEVVGPHGEDILLRLQLQDVPANRWSDQVTETFVVAFDYKGVRFVDLLRGQ